MNTPPARQSLQSTIGLAYWPRPGAEEIEELIGDLERMQIAHLRLGISLTDFKQERARDWYDWVVSRLGRHFDLMLRASLRPPHAAGLQARGEADDSKSYIGFLDELVGRYSTCFRHIELDGEPHGLSRESFAAIVGDAAYRMRRSGRMTALSGMGSADTDWLQLIGRRGILEYIDVAGVRTSPCRPKAQVGEGEIEALKRALHSLGWRGEIWITECGYSTWRNDEGRQVEHLLAADTAQATRFYWNGYRDAAPAADEDSTADERELQTGLLHSDGRRKLAGRLLMQGGISALKRFSETIRSPHLKAIRKRVLVTGGCGFIGSNLADTLAARGEDVLVVDNFSRPGSEENAEWLKSRHRTRIDMESADLRNARDVQSLVSDASAVLHLAAQVAVTTSLQRPQEDFSINAAGTLNLLEALRTKDPDVPLLFASTNKVYGKLFDADEIVDGDDDCAPSDAQFGAGVSETSPLDFYSPYGCSKGVADQYVHDYARVFGLRTVVLRMSCIYGPRQFGTEDQGWLAHFMIRAIRGEPITIYGDGRQVRDVLYIDDAVLAWLRALDCIGRTAGRVFNLGGGSKNAVSLLQAIDVIGQRRGLRPQLDFQETRPGDQPWYVSDTTAFRQATDWRPRTKLPEGMRRLERWLEHRFSPAASDANRMQEVSA